MRQFSTAHARIGVFVSLFSVLVLSGWPVFAETPMDPVSLEPSAIARVGITMQISAGASGAPAGFTVCWMRLSDFIAAGSDWDAIETAGLCLHGHFDGLPTKHTAGMDFILDPSEIVAMEIGDLFDETGVTTDHTDELEPGTQYVMVAYANAFGSQPRSAYSATSGRETQQRNDCLFTQGYWKNHESEWPVNSLTLGTVTYTKAQLLDILNTPAGGNGLIFLAHQVIATKLNIALGASGAAIMSTLSAADALMDGLIIPPVGAGYLAPSSASGLTNMMDAYNNGEYGSEMCQSTPVEEATWGQVKSFFND